jgi:hypothetical protein
MEYARQLFVRTNMDKLFLLLRQASFILRPA